ncbi:MAG: HNH endonuclease signature motif containing protein, partial [Gemmatimonadetes bacterium]|nr:HNH endonuclease signature motif containing protein [Gemmatimonadota bacterium]
EFQLFGQTTINRTDIPEREVSRSKGIRAQLFAKQKGKCRGCNQEFYYSALELDHIVPRSKGGQDGNSNLQLLCGRCNRVKGDRPMAYLLAKMKDERAGA